MLEESNKLNKLFESLNKNLYKSNKLIELYKPLCEILSNLTEDLKELEKTNKNLPHLDVSIEDQIKKRELISLYKKMENIICNIQDEIDYFSKEVKSADAVFEEYRSYRTYIFETPKSSLQFLKKLISDFSIENFALKFNVVGTVDLSEVAKHVKGKKSGIDIIIPQENVNLIYEEVLKSKTTKFRLVTGPLSIYFEKDNVLRIEGPSKKIKLCDINAKEFDADLLDN